MKNYPNPFNASTTIYFSLDKRSTVELVIFNNLGEEIQRKTLENINAGEHYIRFQGDNLKSGIYYYRLSSNNYTQTNKMLLIK